jgi:signal transduction histidine kinase
VRLREVAVSPAITAERTPCVLPGPVERPFTVVTPTRFAPGLVREWVAGEVKPYGYAPARLGDALIVVSELVTNAVTHGTPRKANGAAWSEAWVRVDLACNAEGMVVEVTDFGPGLPPEAMAKLDPPRTTGGCPLRRAPVRPVAHGAESGRGLYLVTLMAECAGAYRDHGDTTVWAHLPGRPGTRPHHERTA